jgi:peptide-methionine (S)-S-oxide reductase
MSARMALPLLTMAWLGLASAIAADDSSREAEASGRAQTASAVFAGGCFWCMEAPFDALEGVLSTTSGFIGGHVSNPSYQQVVAGRTGHVEAVEVRYDPALVDYQTLLEVFWRNVDPLDDGGQFCDRGPAYRTGIFVADEQQRRLAEASKAALESSGRFDRPLVTPIRDLTAFYPAEEYHQDYYLKNPVRYRFYRFNCGRDRRLDELWGR